MKALPKCVERFFAFMRERESIRLKKATGKPWPWTKDKILQTYSFTNVKREHDKTSRLLIEEFYKPHYDAPREQILLNCAIARYFGTIEFMRAVGWQEWFDPEHLRTIAHRRMMRGMKVFTGSYIVTSGGVSGSKVNYVIDNVLTDLWKNRADLIKPWTEWKPMIEELSSIKGYGGTSFMAKELVLDTRYTSFWKEQPTDKNTWTPIGPGSKRGAARILGYTDNRSLTNEETVEVCINLFKQHKAYWPKDYVKLELHDLQFQLCEVSKYEKVRLGQGRPRNKYKPPHERQGKLL